MNSKNPSPKFILLNTPMKVITMYPDNAINIWLQGNTHFVRTILIISSTDEINRMPERPTNRRVISTS